MTEPEAPNYYSIVVQVLLAALIVFIITHFKHLVVLKKLPRDLKLLFRFLKLNYALFIEARKNLSLGQRFELFSKKQPKKVCLYFEEEQWTYEQISNLSNQVANYFFGLGLRKGDTVAIFMENCAEYVFVCLGLSKIGVVTSLINPNLRMQPLRHCLEAVSCKGVIFKSEMLSALVDIRNIGGILQTPLYCIGPAYDSQLANVIDLNTKLKNSSESYPNYNQSDKLSDGICYIFTSGTTGLPKAAICRLPRFMFAALGMNIMIGFRPKDIIYVSLPLCHSAGYLTCVSQLYCYGTPLVIKRKFSANSFWKDCVRYNVTVAIYIGEVCRYLYSQPPCPAERQHKVRLMYGTGLRGDIWPDFVKRFNIPNIVEMYSATESNCSLVNMDNAVGCVGYFPRYLKFLYPARLIKIDDETGQPLRDPKTGFLTVCKPNESGEMIGRIDKNNPFRNFEGYADKSSTEDKIIQDVFRKGDSYFRSGDILVMDTYGYFYFKDRRGDTFRWKGENVSTFEVESVITSACKLKDVVVYGVDIPGYEGRAGMATIGDEDNSIDLTKLAKSLMESLPLYARPIFIRITKHLELTGTYKMKKAELKKEGYNIINSSDKLYILRGDTYILFDDDLKEQIASKNLRL